jgi:putative phage-type endonuclease
VRVRPDALWTPTGKYVGHWTPADPAWHQARAGKLTGSRLAAVLGLSPWESPYSLWCEMTGLTLPPEQTNEMARGHYLEPAVAAWFADQHPDWEIFGAGTYVHRDRPQHLANPDRLIRHHRLPDSMPVGWYDIEVGALLEIKTDADGSGWGEPGTDEIPLYYRTQVQWYMDVLGLPRAHLAVLGGRLQFAEYVVDYDPADAAILRAAADEFLDSLLWQEMPDLDAHPATYEAVKRLHPDIGDEDIDLDDETAAEFLACLAESKSSEARSTAAKTRLAAAMGTAKRARWRGKTIATRQAKGGGTPYLVTGRNLPDPILIGATS